MGILLGQGGSPLLAALSESKTKTQPEPSGKSMLPPESGAWMIEVERWGGYAGMAALHGVRITSEGKVEITSLSKVTCRAQLPKTDLREIEVAVSSAKPSRWEGYYPSDKYSPFHWKLTFHRRNTDGGKQVYNTSGDSSGEQPDDLAAVSGAALKIRNDVHKGCRD